MFPHGSLGGGGVSLQSSNPAMQSPLFHTAESIPRGGCYLAIENKYLFILILTKADKKKPLFVGKKEIITVFSKRNQCW